MDTLKNAKEKYKIGTEIVDLAVVLMNKALKMINDKVLNSAERTNKEIAAGNLDKLRQYGPAYVEMLKNYMTLVTTFNLLVADSHSANYERKMILRAALKLLEKKNMENSDKHDYLLSKILAFEKHIESAAKHIITLSHAIAPISGSAEKKSSQHSGNNGQDESSKSESSKAHDPTEVKGPTVIVKDLKGVAAALTAMGQKLENALSEIRLVDKNMVRLVPKKGSYEHRGGNDDLEHISTATKSRLVKGGVDDTHKSRTKVKIVGGDDTDSIYVGGAALDGNLEKKAVWVEMYNRDKLDRRDNPTYAKMLDNKLMSVFAVGSADEMEKVVGMDDSAFVSKIKKDCNIDFILEKQIAGILEGRKLQQLLAYYIKHRNMYAPSKTELKSESFLMSSGNTDIDNKNTKVAAFSAISFQDDYINLNMTLVENATTNDKLDYIVKFVRTVMEALEKVDIAGIVNQARTCIDKINDVNTPEQLQIAMDDFAKIMNIVENQAPLLLERKRIKMEIMQSLGDVDEPEGVISRPVKPAQPVKGSSIGEMANYLLEKQLAFRPLIGAAEQTCNDQANTLGELFTKIELLESSENKDTCLMKAIMFVNACIYSEVMPKLLEKRFKKNYEAFSDFLKEKVAYLQNVAKPPQLYKKELLESAVRKLAGELVGIEP